jgi:putative drug exporter of the RND superfamily
MVGRRRRHQPLGQAPWRSDAEGLALTAAGYAGTGPVDFAMPVMMFAIVFGLSTDYQVFLLSRVQEECHAHRDNTRAVHAGMTRVSGVITGAAVIMIAVFASFVPGGQRLLQEIGTGFAVAVALDAFLIRFALVPALMYILGDWNWRLPAWLNWLPRLNAESIEAEAEAEAEGPPPLPAAP